MDRHTRQVRLAGVGPEGQARLARGSVDVPGEGFAAFVAARYLAGAGIGALRVASAGVAATVAAVDPAVRVEVASSAFERAAAMPAAPSALEDPDARALAEGALFALSAIRAALAAPEGS